MSRDEIPLLLVLFPLLVFIIWLRSVQAQGNRKTWRRVFRSWRRALRLDRVSKSEKKRSR